MTFSQNDAENIKSIESEINHDLKAIEYFLKSKIENIDELRPYTEFVHFSCTSEDINNLAYARCLKRLRKKFLFLKWRVSSASGRNYARYAEKQ